jgi:hypothetical protein
MKKSSKKLPLLWGALMVLTPVLVWASSLTIPNSFSTGTTISSSQVNQNFAAVQTAVNSKQDAITQTCGAGEAITAIGTTGTTGTATCSAFQLPITQTCAAGQWVNAISPAGATCVGPQWQNYNYPVNEVSTTAGTNTIMSPNPITTGTVANSCHVTAMCTMYAGVAAGGSVFLGMVQQTNGGTVTNLGGWNAAVPATSGSLTSAFFANEIECAANSTCLLGASIYNADAVTGTANDPALRCNITWYCRG